MAEIQITNEDLEYIKNTNPTAYNNHIVNNGTSNSGAGGSGQYGEYITNNNPFGANGESAYPGFVDENGSKYSYNAILDILISSGMTPNEAYDAMSRDADGTYTTAQSKIEAAIKHNISVNEDSIIEQGKRTQYYIDNNDKIAKHYGGSGALAKASTDNTSGKNDNLNTVVDKQTGDNLVSTGVGNGFRREGQANNNPLAETAIDNTPVYDSSKPTTIESTGVGNGVRVINNPRTNPWSLSTNPNAFPNSGNKSNLPWLNGNGSSNNTNSGPNLKRTNW